MESPVEYVIMCRFATVSIPGVTGFMYHDVHQFQKTGSTISQDFFQQRFVDRYIVF
jgi:hypothetical protein